MAYIRFIFCFLFMIWNSVLNSQTIFDSWIGENLEFIEIKRYKIIIREHDIVEKSRSRVINDTILIKDYFLDIDSLNKYVKIPIEYKINYKLIDDSNLILIPLNFSSNFFIQDTTFYKRKSIYYTDIKFQKILFKSSQCYGKCPVMELYIDSNGKVFFTGKENTSHYVGEFTGTLSKRELAKFRSILYRCNVNDLPEKMGLAIDAPIYSIEIFYNNKCKKSNGHEYPYQYEKLIKYMLSIYKHVKLYRVK